MGGHVLGGLLEMVVVASVNRARERIAKLATTVGPAMATVTDPEARAAVHAAVRSRLGALGPDALDEELSWRLIRKHAKRIKPLSCCQNSVRIWRAEPELPAGTLYAEGVGVWDYGPYYSGGPELTVDFQGHMRLPDGRVIDVMLDFFKYSVLVPFVTRRREADVDEVPLCLTYHFAERYHVLLERVWLAYKAELEAR